ncbi:hypothetical protein KC19_VG248600 [Ceratodon purpureus]|uniref:Uncharacterized protein n=1 Tax=Ceratodon purpureus TaxID=3225 RepID=A0A8T0HU56_CERPU|nr:hypothetical protein KC19_VG248600 [Ceratodon purpureus]
MRKQRIDCQLLLLNVLVNINVNKSLFDNFIFWRKNHVSKFQSLI